MTDMLLKPVPDLLRCSRVPKVARNFSPLRCICSGVFDDRQMGGLFLCGHAFFEWDNPYPWVAFIPKIARIYTQI
jgi:hypothetical protein